MEIVNHVGLDLKHSFNLLNKRKAKGSNFNFCISKIKENRNNVKYNYPGDCLNLKKNALSHIFQNVISLFSPSK